MEIPHSFAHFKGSTECVVSSNDEEEYSLYSTTFDINKHKEKYPNYFEVLILKDGTIMYAVPSHQELAIQLACHNLGITREQLIDRCSPEYYVDFLYWILTQTGSIAVWDRFYLGDANDIQKEVLHKLLLSGIYKGKINLE